VLKQQPTLYVVLRMLVFRERPMKTHSDLSIYQTAINCHQQVM